MARRYLYDKPASGINSYQKYLNSEVNKVSLQGALVEVKEYTLRIPSNFAKKYEITGKRMRDDNVILVTLVSNRKDIADLMITKKFYYGTCKDRMDFDYMIESARCNFILPLQRCLESKKA
tara:strand:+ start:144 stop:506 length:363 start_codon:yes stop_codon:yes gene_type:complete